MQPPSVKSTMIDEDYKMTYQFMAYRPLNRQEMIQGIREYFAQPRIRRRKTRETGKTVTIITSIGFDR
jgi:hypothetical protein